MLLLIIFKFGGVDPVRLHRASIVVTAVVLLIFVWAHFANLETTIDERMVTRTQGSGPFRRTIAFSIEDISSVEVPAYSTKLVATMRDGHRIVIANQYSSTKDPLPEIRRNSGDPSGRPHFLRRIKMAIESRRNIEP